MKQKRTRKSAVKRLFFDIETAPNVGLFWGAGFKLTISPENIVKERAIICIAYKWQNEKKVTVLRWAGSYDDREMLEKFIPVLEEADEAVGHFASGFDAPWVRTRALYHRIPMSPDIRIIDTKHMASKNFYFNSNKLDYISKFLGHGGKLPTDFELWKRIVLDNEPAAMAYMMKYCGKDVVRLQQAFEEIEPYCKHHTHAAVLAGGERWHCPNCGSKSVKKKMLRVTAAGHVRHQMNCKKCGRIYSISNTAHSAYVKATK